MALDLVPTGRDVPNDVNVIVEIPKDADPVKYEVDKATGAIFVDRILSTPVTAEGRNAAIAAAAPLVGGWIEALRTAHASMLRLEACELEMNQQRVRPQVDGEPTAELDEASANLGKSRDELRARSAVADALANFSFITHFDAFTKGIIDPKDVIFFLSLMGFTLFLNVVVLER